MKFLSVCASTAVLVVALGAGAAAQSPVPTSPPAATQAASAPTLMPISGALKTPTGEPRTGSVLLVSSVYATQDDPTPLWIEEQLVTLDAAGRYTLVVGLTLAEGMPKELFLTGAARWLGVAVQGEPEPPRMALVSVPYALKAREAESLSGKASSDFVLSDQLTDSVKAALTATKTDGSTTNFVGATDNRISKFTAGATDLTNSSLFENAATGFVGIGTTVPAVRLDVAGAIQAGTDYLIGGWKLFTFGGVGNGTLQLGNGGAGTWQGAEIFTNNASRLYVANSGNVGIGTTTPAVKFDVAGAIQAGTEYYIGGWKLFTYGGVGNGTLQLGNGGAGTWQGAEIFTNNVSRLYIGASGNIGIGTTTPGSKLDVAGNINVTGNINAKYQDVAEWVETPEPLDAGTVVIVDPLEPNRVLRATRPYDTRVAGAVSAQPGLLLGERSDTKSMVAQSGRVRVKVDAKYGAIRTGDLLVTSPTAGHAMRSRPLRVAGQSLHRPGTLVGKALEPLATGTGEILVLLTLQ